MQKSTQMFFVILALTITTVSTPEKLFAVTPAQITSPYLYNFNLDGVLNEAGSQSDTTSPYWWVNSGAKMIMKGGRGSTVIGELPDSDYWRVLYSKNNSTDTDNGYHPQNIFRLVTTSKWQDFQQEAYFVIKKDNLSKSSNRNQSNGLLLFNRYKDGQSLYYTGVRVDGSAIIKKKLNGTYYTMAEIKNIYPGTYNRDTSPNLLPKNKWIGLRSQVKNQADGSVIIKLFVDRGWSGNWELVAETVDNGTKYGPVISTGYAGIRTDFMDVEFENFRLKTI